MDSFAKSARSMSFASSMLSPSARTVTLCPQQAFAYHCFQASFQPEEGDGGEGAWGPLTA